MTIAYCTAVFPSSSETFVRRELAFLRSRGVNVRVWALRGETSGGSPDEFAVVYRPGRCSLAALRSLMSLGATPLRAAGLLGLVAWLALFSPRLAVGLLANLPAIGRFARDAREHGVDHVHGCFVNLPGLIAMGVSALTGVPFTAAAHARDVFVEGAALPVIARRARFILACNAPAADHIRCRMAASDRTRLHLLHHGLDIEPACRSARRAGQDDPFLLAAGRFVPKKGFAHLIRAMALLRERGVSIRLALVGKGPLAPALRDLARQLGVSDLISWPGWLSEPAVRQLMGEASALVVPSVVAADGDQDGIPNVVLEAWATGLPVIASALPGLAGAIGHEFNGLLVEPADPADLARAIARLLSDRELAERLSGNARDSLRKRFNLQANASRLLTLFTRVCDGHGAA